jgi:hypothetical protein
LVSFAASFSSCSRSTLRYSINARRKEEGEIRKDGEGGRKKEEGREKREEGSKKRGEWV